MGFNPHATFSLWSGSVGDPFEADIPQDFSINNSDAIHANHSVKVLIDSGSDGIIWRLLAIHLDSHKFSSIQDSVWKVDNGNIVGTYKIYAQFTLAQFFNTENSATKDQPEAVWKILKNWFVNHRD